MSCTRVTSADICDESVDGLGNGGEMTIGDGRRRIRRVMGRYTLSNRFVILDYRAPEGSQSIDNTEEFERVKKCVEEGKDPYEGRHSYCGFGMRRKHLRNRRPS